MARVKYSYRAGDIKEYILAARGITDEFEAMKFTSGGFNTCSEFPDGESVNILLQKIGASKNICVFGDYDADGITAASIMRLYLPNAKIVIPERSDGYGLTEKNIDKISDDTDLLITVDCGITSVEAVGALQGRGIDVVVTDHHNVGQTLPECLIFHPTLSKCSFKKYSGAGVAYKLMMAAFPNMEYEHSLAAQLAAVGTVCDMMPMLNENRAIVVRGLNRIHRDPLPGIYALAKAMNEDHRNVNESFIGFNLGPAINACGRMGNAALAYNLLSSSSATAALPLAKEAKKYNDLRKKSTASSLADAEVVYDGHVIVVKIDGAMRGSLGLVATQLNRKTGKPAIVYSSHDGISHASVRGGGWFRCGDFLSYCEECIISGGGHDNAAGFSFAEKNIECLLSCIHTYTQGNKFVVTQEKVYDIAIDFSVVDSIYRDVFSLAPYGNEFESPVFVSVGAVEQVKPLGKDKAHQLIVVDGNDILMFHRDDEMCKTGDTVSVAYTINPPGAMSSSGYSLIGVDVEVLD